MRCHKIDIVIIIQQQEPVVVVRAVHFLQRRGHAAGLVDWQVKTEEESELVRASNTTHDFNHESIHSCLFVVHQTMKKHHHPTSDFQTRKKTCLHERGFPVIAFIKLHPISRHHNQAINSILDAISLYRTKALRAGKWRASTRSNARTILNTAAANSEKNTSCPI